MAYSSSSNRRRKLISLGAIVLGFVLWAIGALTSGQARSWRD